MDSEPIETVIEHHAAALRAAFPYVDSCRAVLQPLGAGLAQRYSVALDIRWPQHQTLISGKSKHDPHAAVYAAFDAAHHQLDALKARRP